MNQDQRTETTVWQTLSIWSLCYFVLQGFRLLYQQIYVVIPIALAVKSSEMAFLYWLLPLLVVAFILINAYLNYRFYHYKITDTEILVRQGWLKKKQINLKFERIQNINLIRPFYFRPLHLVTLAVDGAGSSGEEVRLLALTEARAEALKIRLLAGQSEYKEALDNAEVGTVFTRSVRDLVLHGLSNGKYFLLSIIAILYSQFREPLHDLFPEDLWQTLTVMFLSPVNLILFIALTFILLTLLFSVIWVLVKYYGYELADQPEGLSLRRGLLTRHETQARKSRIQTIEYRQKWVEAWFGKFNLRFEQVGLSASVPGAEVGSEDIFVPSVTAKQASELMAWLIPTLDPTLDPTRLIYEPVAGRFFVMKVLRWTCLFTVSGVVIGLSVPKLVLTIAACTCLLILTSGVLQYAHWRKTGICLSGNCLVIRRGSFSTNYKVMQTHKLQQVKLIQSRLMKRGAFASVYLQTAAGVETVAYLNETYARQLLDICLYQLESSDLSWM